MAQKKLLFVITQDVLGGPQTFLLHFLPELRQRGADLLVAVGADGDGEFTKELARRSIPYRTLRFLRKPLFAPWYDLPALAELVRVFRREQPGTVMLLTAKAGIVGTVAARLAGIPRIIYRLGGFAFLRPDLPLRRPLYLVEKLVSRWRDLIVVNSEHERNILIRSGIAQPGKIRVIYNSSPPVAYLDREAARRFLYQRIPAPPCSESEFLSATVVGAVSRLERVKGVRYLVEAARGLTEPRCLFLVIGEGEERRYLERMIERLGLTRTFLLLGSLPEASRYLKALDIFVLPSIFEGLSWSVIEAMFARVPIVASNVGGVAEVVIDGESGLLVPLADPERLREAIRVLLRDPQKRLELAGAARRRADAKLSFPEILRQWLEILRL